MNFIIRLLITGAVAYGLGHFLGGIHFSDFKAALIFALVLGLVNAIIKPIVKILSLPITIVTLGLFLLVINALMILITDYFLNSVQVDGFWWALVFGLLLSAVSSLLSSMVTDKD